MTKIKAANTYVNLASLSKTFHIKKSELKKAIKAGELHAVAIDENGKVEYLSSEANVQEYLSVKEKADEQLTIKQLSEEYGISEGTIRSRIQSKELPAQLTQPVTKKGHAYYLIRRGDFEKEFGDQIYTRNLRLGRKEKIEVDSLNAPGRKFSGHKYLSIKDVVSEYGIPFELVKYHTDKARDWTTIDGFVKGTNRRCKLLLRSQVEAFALTYVPSAERTKQIHASAKAAKTPTASVGDTSADNTDTEYVVNGNIISITKNNFRSLLEKVGKMTPDQAEKWLEGFEVRDSFK